MTEEHHDRLPIRSEHDIVRLRQIVRERAARLTFSIVDQTKIVTAASELARNAVVYAAGGTVEIEELERADRRGLRLVFVDEGPGIADVELAMRDGYTTGSGLGLGLGGAKRLVSEFEIHSSPGEGTRVAITRWK